MKILFCGDINGRSGRKVILEKVPELREQLALDFVIVNGENAAAGFGITSKICEEFHAAGVDVITTGNHIWDNKEIIPKIDQLPKLLRPLNYPQGTPGRGIGHYTTPNGKKVVVINIMGSLFMNPLDDPFARLNEELSKNILGRTCDALIVDFHAEASSEKMALAHFIDGKASLVVGTHTHVPTADAQILPKGTAYQTDSGMCGDYDSVIGMKKEIPIIRFTRKFSIERLSPAEGEATLCGVYIETDTTTGLAKYIAPLRLGGCLDPYWPIED